MAEASEERVARIAVDPYGDVYGRFWDGMSFLLASSNEVERLVGLKSMTQFSAVSAGSTLQRYFEDMRDGRAAWPQEIVLWQSYAHLIVESHGLLDEYLRGSFEVLLLSRELAGFDMVDGWEPEAVSELRELEVQVAAESQRFEQLDLWNRLARLRSVLGLKVRLGRKLEAALMHHRRIRNGIVHGQLTPHLVMPDGTIARTREYAPPPYIPLGPHVVRGVVSVILAAHQSVDAVIAERLGIEEDHVTTQLLNAQVEQGRDKWLVDPWEPDPEHLFTAQVLRAWRPPD